MSRRAARPGAPRRGSAGRAPARSQRPSGSSTTLATIAVARSPGSSSTRITAPTTTPGRLPATSSQVSGPNRRPSRPNRNRPPGIAATLNSRLVGVTDGLGTPSTLTCTGSSSTAPDTPAGVVTSAIRKASRAPTGHSHGTRPAYPAGRARPGGSPAATTARLPPWRRRHRSGATGGCGCSAATRASRTARRRRWSCSSTSRSWSRSASPATSSPTSWPRSTSRPASAGSRSPCSRISWAWINFSWFASAYDTDDWLFRLLTMVQMVGVLILALGLPAMFDPWSTAATWTTP